VAKWQSGKGQKIGAFSWWCRLEERQSRVRLNKHKGLITILLLRIFDEYPKYYFRFSAYFLA